MLTVLGGCDGGKPPPAAAHARDAAIVRPSADAAIALPPHWTAPDLATALGKILTDDVRVAAFGELHARVDRAPHVRSALARFDAEVLPVIAARASDLVMETWVLDPKCGTQAATATAQVETAMQRPAATKSELALLVEHARAAKIQPHAMRLSCADWREVAPAPPDGGAPAIDYEKLLNMITRELGRIATEAVAYRDKKQDPRRLVAVYGGAMHNDLYPQDGLTDWSFAAAVDHASGGRFVEVDLYVPEFAAVDDFTAREPWLPLLAQSRADQVVVIERGPRSFVILLARSPT